MKQLQLYLTVGRTSFTKLSDPGVLRSHAEHWVSWRHEGVSWKSFESRLAVLLSLWVDQVIVTCMDLSSQIWKPSSPWQSQKTYLCHTSFVRTSSTISTVFRTVFSHNLRKVAEVGRQECWSALGAERDGVLRLRHLDRRSDELTGSSVGDCLFLPLCWKSWAIFGLNFVPLPWVHPKISKFVEGCSRSIHVDWYLCQQWQVC